jgi:tetratricopeptide (TPR) repeat protein
MTSHLDSAEFTEPAAVTGRRPTAAACLAVALAAGLLTCFIFAPRFVTWRGVLVSQQLPYPEIHRAHDSLRQLQDPWAVPDAASNNVISWRLFFPLLWYWLSLPVWLFLAMPAVGCLLALWLAAWLTYQRLRDWWQTGMSVTLFAALPWFFVSSGWLTYFDSWLILGLLIVGFLRSRSALALTCLITPWIDERFLLALPLTLAARMIDLRTVERRAWREFALDVAVIVAASLPYPAIRAIVWLRGDPDSTAYVQTHWTEILYVPFSRFLEGLWSGYRVAWLMVFAAVWFWAGRVGRVWGLLLTMLVATTSVGALCIAADMSRTFAIEATIMLVGIWLWQASNPRSFAYALPLVLAANLLLPAAHVVWPFHISIRYLYAQFDACDSPPSELQPQKYVEMGKARLRRGNRKTALEAFEDALRLDKDFVPAYVGRASLRLISGDQAAALEDAETALRLQRGEPDALFVRAAVRESRGERIAAAADLEMALKGAPPNWAQREQAQRYLDQAREAEPVGPGSFQ